MLETLIVVNLIINIIGALILGRWIYALKGTIEAQAATIATIKHVNETVLNVFKTLDPDRWAKEVEIHKRLADEKAKALVDDAQRKFEAEKNAMHEEDRESFINLLISYGDAVGATVKLIAWIPKSLRMTAIEGVRMSKDSSLRPMLLKIAQDSPDLSLDVPSLFALLSGRGV